MRCASFRRGLFSRSLVAAACCASCTSIRVADAAEPTAPRTTGELRKRIAEAIDGSDVTGLGVVLVSTDDILWSAEFGTADRAAQRPVASDTLFRAGSISKSFVALAALKLQEEGKLRLSDPVRELVGDAEFANPWEATDPVRLEHLLEHTAGFDDISLREFGANVPGISLRDGLAFHPASRTSRWPPGRFFSYSNAGPPLAAFAVELASGQMFEDFVREKFFEPLDMPTASFVLTDVVEERLAKCYEDDGVTEIPYHHIMGRPSGSLNVTPRELAHLVQMLLNRGAYGGVQLLAANSIDRMETAATNIAAASGLKVGYGLANFVKIYEGFPIHGHEGAITRYLAAYGYSPDLGVGYVCMMTSNEFESLVRVEKLIWSYLTRNEVKLASPPAALTKAGLQEFAGYYEPYTPRFEFSRFMLRLMGLRRFAVEGDHLRPAGPGSARQALFPTDEPGLFRYETDPAPTLAFVNRDGEQFLVSGDLSSVNFRRVPAWWAWGQGAVVGVCAALMLSAVLFAMWWAPQGLLGWRPISGELAVRVPPLVASVSGPAIFVVFWSALRHPVDRLSQPTPWSVGIWLLSWVFLVATVVGLVQSLRAGWSGVRLAVRRHALLVSLANGIVLSYLAYWGVIGWRSWS